MCGGVAGAPHDAGPSPAGLFVYPLDEYTTVIGFEAVIADRVVTVQIKDKAKLDNSHFEGTRVRATSVTGEEERRAVAGVPGLARVSSRLKGQQWDKVERALNWESGMLCDLRPII